jgi:opacity protein-like surface antigen
MRRKLLVVALVSVFSLVGGSMSWAQDGAFTNGHMDVGPTIGFGGISGGTAFGGRFEKGFKELPNLGNGVLGLQVSVDYYNYDYGNDFFFNGDHGISVLPISVLVNYHIHLNNQKLDPFVGAGIGYERVSSNFDCETIFGTGFNCDFSSNSMYFAGRAGIRYFFQPRMALYADVGAGAASMNVGLMFKIGGK